MKVPIVNKTTKFYFASKAKHAEIWRKYRSSGYRITSTWIDESGEGETSDYSELSVRCLSEVGQCDVLILYCEPGELLKGALIEVGSALVLGKEVRCVGASDSLSRVFIQHPSWRPFQLIVHALEAKQLGLEEGR